MTGKAPIPEAALERHRETLAAFVVRCRRIEAHSLLIDKDQFLLWASGTAKAEMTGGAGSLSFELPPEEPFESLATRCRPLLLEGEPVFYFKVFGALKAFLRDDDELMATVDCIRAGWRAALNPEMPILMGVVDRLERPDDLLRLVDVADGWLYGDLVHADPEKRALVARISLDNRYVAAVVVYGQVAVHALMVLNLIRHLHGAARIELDQAVFDEPVSAAVPLVLPLAAMRITPVPGTE